jgi:hypothetical protein
VAASLERLLPGRSTLAAEGCALAERDLGAPKRAVLLACLAIEPHHTYVNGVLLNLFLGDEEFLHQNASARDVTQYP